MKIATCSSFPPSTSVICPVRGSVLVFISLWALIYSCFVFNTHFKMMLLRNLSMAHFNLPSAKTVCIWDEWNASSRLTYPSWPSPWPPPLLQAVVPVLWRSPWTPRYWWLFPGFKKTTTICILTWTCPKWGPQWEAIENTTKNISNMEFSLSSWIVLWWFL